MSKFNNYYDKCLEVAHIKCQIFLGFKEDNSKSVKLKSRCKLYCKKTGNYWETTSIEKHLKREGCSCKTCSQDRRNKSSRLSEDYLLSEAKSFCETYGTEFLGWKDPELGIYRHLIQKCVKHGEVWDTTAIKAVIDGINAGSGCPTCRKEKLLNMADNRDEEHIECFMSTGAFLKGTMFWRSDRLTKCGGRNYWKYTCPKCSKDEYVTAGVCSGIFESFVGTLKQGSLACRCSTGYKWTTEQKEHRIKKELKDSGVTFKGWLSKYRVQLSCMCGKEWDAYYNNIVLKGNRCPECSKYQSVWGIYKGKENVKDFLYLLTFKNDDEFFTKIGRSFNIDKRLRDYPNNNYNVTLLGYYTCKHEEIYKLEKKLQRKMKLGGYHYVPLIPFGGSVQECFTTEILNHPEIISTFNLHPS